MLGVWLEPVIAQVMMVFFAEAMLRSHFGL
jgi:hypothetical protein